MFELFIYTSINYLILVIYITALDLLIRVFMFTTKNQTSLKLVRYYKSDTVILKTTFLHHRW